MTHGHVEASTTAFASILFPGNPMVNSLLATSYISIIPNLLLYFVPPNIKSTTLSTLVHFAVGSLLGDVFLHLLPHAFSEPHQHHHHHGQHNDGNQRNVVIGIGVFAGLFIFYATDKLMRAFLEREDGHHHHHNHHDHNHTYAQHQLHDHDLPPKETKECIVDQVAISDSVETEASCATLKQRKQKPNNPHSTLQEKDAIVNHTTGVTSIQKGGETGDKKSITVRASTYLNLLADFTHNLTDGIAMAASFYASPAIGTTTAIAVFFHEIPHEISDYAILLQSGFNKKKAMMAQFTTAIGAYLGTLIGICVEELIKATSSTSSSIIKDHQSHPNSQSLLGTGVGWNDLIIPLTAGGFLYIATVNVMPEMLSSNNSSSQKNKNSNDRGQLVKELLAMVFGMTLMAVMAWNETHTH